MHKLKVAFVHKSHPYLTDTYFSQQYNYFFNGALKRNQDIEVVDCCVDEVDPIWLNGFDVVLLMGLKASKLPTSDWRKCNTIKISCCHDCHVIDGEYVKRAESFGINHFFYHHPEKYFRKFAPDHWKYKRVFMCIDKEVYSRCSPWEYRIKDMVLHTGHVDNGIHYELRPKLIRLDGVHHINRSNFFTGRNYVKLLNSFCASIAACSTVTVNKYLESMTAGCITFTEVNDNNGWEELELIDNVNCVMIKEDNYKSKISEYIECCNDPRYQLIGNEARRIVMNRFNTDIQAEGLVEWIKEII